MLTWLACLGNVEEAGFDAVSGRVSVDPETGVNHFDPAVAGAPHRYVRMARDSAWFAARFRSILGEKQ